MPETKKIPAATLKLVQRPATDSKGRPITEKKGDQEVPKLRPIREDEVLSWRETDEEVVVVTEDGQKFRAEKTR